MSGKRGESKLREQELAVVIAAVGLALVAASAPLIAAGGAVFLGWAIVLLGWGFGAIISGGIRLFRARRQR